MQGQQKGSQFKTKDWILSPMLFLYCSLQSFMHGRSASEVMEADEMERIMGQLKVGGWATGPSCAAFAGTV